MRILLLTPRKKDRKEKVGRYFLCVKQTDGTVKTLLCEVHKTEQAKTIKCFFPRGETQEVTSFKDLVKNK